MENTENTENTPSLNDRDPLITGRRLLVKLFEEGSKPPARWLTEKVNRGLIPCHRVGRLRFYREREVLAAMKGGAK